MDARLLATALASGIALAACGASSPSGVPTIKKSTPSRSSAASTGSASQPHKPKTAAGSLDSQELAYSRCMRANGVPGFPDPNPGGGFTVHPGSGGVDPGSPQYQAANAKCQKLLPGADAGPTINPREGAALVKIATCMRAHGIAGFPDPVRARSGSLPTPKPGYSRITNFEGWLLEFPATIDMQSPAYARAAAACGAGFLNRPQ